MSQTQLDLVHVDEPRDGDPDATRFSFDSQLAGGRVTLTESLEHQPEGIRSAALMAGIKYADKLDFMVVTLPAPGPAVGVFTRNRSCSPAVTLDRQHLEDGEAQTLVVISKNANVFTPTAMDDTRAIVNEVAKRLAVRDERLAVALVHTAVEVRQLVAGKTKQVVRDRQRALFVRKCNASQRVRMDVDHQPPSTPL